MNIETLVGAIIGSGVAIFMGRPPALRLVALIQARIRRR